MHGNSADVDGIDDLVPMGDTCIPQGDREAIIQILRYTKATQIGSAITGRGGPRCDS